MSKPSDASSSDPAAIASHPAAKPADHVRANPWDFMFDVHHNPCFRQSLMWGGGIGATMATHSALRHRSQLKALNAFMSTFLLVSGVGWIYCRSSQRKEQAQMREIMEKVKQVEDKKAAAAKAQAGTNAGK